MSKKLLVVDNTQPPLMFKRKNPVLVALNEADKAIATAKGSRDAQNALLPALELLRDALKTSEQQNAELNNEVQRFKNEASLAKTMQTTSVGRSQMVAEGNGPDMTSITNFLKAIKKSSRNSPSLPLTDSMAAIVGRIIATMRLLAERDGLVTSDFDKLPFWWAKCHRTSASEEAAEMDTLGAAIAATVCPKVVAFDAGSMKPYFDTEIKNKVQQHVEKDIAAAKRDGCFYNQIWCHKHPANTLDSKGDWLIRWVYDIDGAFIFTYKRYRCSQCATAEEAAARANPIVAANKKGSTRCNNNDDDDDADADESNEISMMMMMNQNNNNNNNSQQVLNNDGAASAPASAPAQSASAPAQSTTTNEAAQTEDEATKETSTTLSDILQSLPNWVYWTIGITFTHKVGFTHRLQQQILQVALGKSTYNEEMTRLQRTYGENQLRKAAMLQEFLYSLIETAKDHHSAGKRAGSKIMHSVDSLRKLAQRFDVTQSATACPNSFVGTDRQRNILSCAPYRYPSGAFIRDTIAKGRLNELRTPLQIVQEMLPRTVTLSMDSTYRAALIAGDDVRSVYIVIDCYGRVLVCVLTPSDSYVSIRPMLQEIAERPREDLMIAGVKHCFAQQVIYTDKCCVDLHLLRDVFTQDCLVKLDAFHYLRRWRDILLYRNHPQAAEMRKVAMLMRLALFKKSPTDATDKSIPPPQELAAALRKVVEECKAKPELRPVVEGAEFDHRFGIQLKHVVNNCLSDPPGVPMRIPHIQHGYKKAHSIRSTSFNESIHHAINALIAHGKMRKDSVGNTLCFFFANHNYRRSVDYYGDASFVFTDPQTLHRNRVAWSKLHQGIDGLTPIPDRAALNGTTDAKLNPFYTKYFENLTFSGNTERSVYMYDDYHEKIARMSLSAGVELHPVPEFPRLVDYLNAADTVILSASAKNIVIPKFVADKLDNNMQGDPVFAGTPKVSSAATTSGNNDDASAENPATDKRHHLRNILQLFRPDSEKKPFALIDEFCSMDDARIAEVTIDLADFQKNYGSLIRLLHRTTVCKEGSPLVIAPLNRIEQPTPLNNDDGDNADVDADADADVAEQHTTMPEIESWIAEIEVRRSRKHLVGRFALRFYLQFFSNITATPILIVRSGRQIETTVKEKGQSKKIVAECHQDMPLILPSENSFVRSRIRVTPANFILLNAHHTTAENFTISVIGVIPATIQLPIPAMKLSSKTANGQRMGVDAFLKFDDPLQTEKKNECDCHDDLALNLDAISTDNLAKNPFAACANLTQPATVGISLPATSTTTTSKSNSIQVPIVARKTQAPTTVSMAINPHQFQDAAAPRQASKTSQTLHFSHVFQSSQQLMISAQRITGKSVTQEKATEIVANKIKDSKKETKTNGAGKKK
jgi:hypothetical protein